MNNQSLAPLWKVLVVLGAVLAVLTVVTANWTVSVGSVSCGNWISRDYEDAKDADWTDTLADTMLGGQGEDQGVTVQACRDAVSGRTPLIAFLGFAAVVALVGAMFVRMSSRSPGD